MIKVASIAALAMFASAGVAHALTVSNTGDKAYSIGIDMGNKEMTKDVAAGNSVKIDGCASGCGVTGPWGYSWWANAGDTIKSDGKPLVTTN